MRYVPSEARIVWSASDLKAAAECEFAWLRAIDARLGRCEAVEEPEDATLARAGELGDVHEQRVLADYREKLGDGVVEIEKVSSRDAAALAGVVAQTDDALRSGDAQLVFQAAFATDEFVGFADFLLRDADGRWRVQDSKLARTARVTALMQLAAYVDQLDRLGIPRSDHVDLLLGDGTTSTHAVSDILPLLEVRRDRLRELIDDRDLASGAAGEAIAWGDGRGELHVTACGRCATCEVEVVAHRDLLLVAGMRPSQRDRLRAAGIRTIDELADAVTAPRGMSTDVFVSLRTQARLQREVPTDEDHPVPPYEVVNAAALGSLPRPDEGDIFFDFEGDPLYNEGPSTGPSTGSGQAAGTDWGIDYLFGWVDLSEQYSALWAHDMAEEKRALEEFCDDVALRRFTNPGMHIYHYAPYETSHLVNMAARHGVREAEVDDLLRSEVFVDLYPVVRRAVRVGSRSYSIKKLEPLYMGDEVRTADVKKGDDSIVRYVESRAL
ncbi:MAG: TM0106 family RecB-like putative nuclease, partial [Microbacterium sp.]